MKAVVVSLFIMVTTICNATAQSYVADIAYCDKVYEEQSANEKSTLSIIGALSDHTDCYERIVFKIIDAKYSQNSDNMKQNFTDYIKLASEMVGFISRPDSCYPHCGTSVGINAAKARRDAALHYLDSILKHNEPI